MGTVLHKTLEGCSAVLSSQRYTPAAASTLPQLLINRQTSVELYSVTDDGLALTSHWDCHTTVAHVLHIKGDYIVLVTQSGTCSVARLSQPGPHVVASCSLPQPEGAALRYDRICARGICMHLLFKGRQPTRMQLAVWPCILQALVACVVVGHVVCFICQHCSACLH